MMLFYQVYPDKQISKVMYWNLNLLRKCSVVSVLSITLFIVKLQLIMNTMMYIFALIIYMYE